MTDQFEYMLFDVFGTEDFFPKDDLSLMIHQAIAIEVSEEELDFVAAAHAADYMMFLKCLKEKKQ